MATARKKGRGYGIRVSCGVDVNGKRLGKSKTWVPDSGMTPKQIEKELERQKILFEEEIRNGNSPDDKIRFADFSKRWMEEYGKTNLTIKTYNRYNDFLKRINPSIGHLRLKDITPLHLNSFYRSLEADGVRKRRKLDENGKEIVGGGLAPKTIVDHHRLVSKILSTAVKWGLIEKNAAQRADPPKIPYREISYLNEDQLIHMFKLFESEPLQYKTMITMLIYAGMRRGELCGLEWKDIDFENATMSICCSSQYIGNKTIITKEPKTYAGIRKFTLSESACELLKQYRTWQLKQRIKIGDRWNESNRLFTAWDGSPINPDTVTDWFSKFIKKSDLPHVTLHSLRHSNATIMIAEGADVRTVSNRLGHANTATTLNIYTYALESKDREAAKAIKNALRGVEKIG